MIASQNCQGYKTSNVTSKMCTDRECLNRVMCCSGNPAKTMQQHCTHEELCESHPNFGSKKLNCFSASSRLLQVQPRGHCQKNPTSNPAGTQPLQHKPKSMQLSAKLSHTWHWYECPRISTKTSRAHAQSASAQSIYLSLPYMFRIVGHFVWLFPIPYVWFPKTSQSTCSTVRSSLLSHLPPENLYKHRQSYENFEKSSHNFRQKFS